MIKCLVSVAGAVVGFILLLPAGSYGQSVSGSVVVTVSPQLALVVNPTSATITCDSPAGTVVSAITTTGGNNKPQTLAIAGATADFALSNNSPPANVIVGPNGLVTAGCSATLPMTETVTISVKQ